MHTAAPDDQAATLRRLFARRAVRVLPVWVSAAREAQLAVWMARLAQCFAQHGERTLVIDAARLHVAAALGLRARHDLQHVLKAECSLAQALLDAAAGLMVLPAARAFDAASAGAPHSGVQRQRLAHALPWVAAAAGCERVLLLFSTAQCAVLPAGCDCVLPVHGASVRHLVRDVNELAARADLADFRLLFLDMEPQRVTTLASRLRASSATWADRVQLGGQARVSRELVHVVRSAAGWRCAALRTESQDAMESRS